MNSKKNNMVDTDEDLKFIPLNLNEPFKSKDSSWAPLINIDVETENMTNNFFISLPDLQTNNGFTPLPSVNANPILPYPTTTTNPSMNGLNNNYDNMDLNNNLNIPPDNTNNISDENELYPSETSKDELYSYNTDSNNSNNSNNNNSSNKNTLTHLDILRDFDLSLDSDIIDTTSGYRSDDIDRIFNNIEENDGDLLCALKAYNVPYPIASLILKKTIKSAINNLTNV